MKVRAYIVEYVHNGEPAEFITRVHQRALDYAAEHHGVVFPLGIIEEQPVREMQPMEDNGQTPC